MGGTVGREVLKIGSPGDAVQDVAEYQALQLSHRARIARGFLFHFGQSAEREGASRKAFPGRSIEDALACVGQSGERIIPICTGGNAQGGFTKECEAGDELEHVDLPAHEMNEGVALVENLFLHSRDGGQIILAKLRILQICAGLIQISQSIELRHVRVPEPAKLREDIPDPVARFPAAAKLPEGAIDSGASMGLRYLETIEAFHSRRVSHVT